MVQAEHIVAVLLEGTDDMVQHLGRLAVNPAYEFEDAITNKKHLHKTYPAPKDWAYDLEIDIKPPGYDFVKTAWITIRYKRKDPGGTPSMHSGGYAAYRIEDAKKVAGRLHQLLIVSRNPVSDHDMNSMYFNLVSLRKPSKNSRMDKKTHGYFRGS
jgi:hypothetical protein